LERLEQKEDRRLKTETVGREQESIETGKAQKKKVWIDGKNTEMKKCKLVISIVLRFTNHGESQQKGGSKTRDRVLNEKGDS